MPASSPSSWKPETGTFTAVLFDVAKSDGARAKKDCKTKQQSLQVSRYFHIRSSNIWKSWESLGFTEVLIILNH
jgi:hypothetical protein